MSIESLKSDLERAIRDNERIHVREALARSIMVGPYDDAGVAAPGSEKGPGFAVFIGEWRLGWWATRNEACIVAYGLEHAIKDHPLP